MRRLRHLTHCGQNESQKFQLLDCALCCVLCSWHKEILGSLLLLLPKAHVHRNVPKCLATSKKLAKNSNPMSAEDETDSMSTPSWKMRGGQCRCCPNRNSWTMVSKARHLTCDHKEAWQSNEDNTTRPRSTLLTIHQGHRMHQKTKAPDTAICAQGLWNQQKGMSTILTRFRRVPLGREHPELCAEHKTSWRNRKWMQVVIMRWLLPWRAALKQGWQEGRMLNSSFSCWSLDLSLPPTSSNLYQTTDPCHAHTFWTFWLWTLSSVQSSANHEVRIWSNTCTCKILQVQVQGFKDATVKVIVWFQWFHHLLQGHAVPGSSNWYGHFSRGMKLSYWVGYLHRRYRPTSLEWRKRWEALSDLERPIRSHNLRNSD